MNNTDRINDIMRTLKELGITRLDGTAEAGEPRGLRINSGWLDEDDKADEHNEKDR